MGAPVNKKSRALPSGSPFGDLRPAAPTLSCGPRSRAGVAPVPAVAEAGRARRPPSLKMS